MYSIAPCDYKESALCTDVKLKTSAFFPNASHIQCGCTNFTLISGGASRYIVIFDIKT